MLKIFILESINGGVEKACSLHREQICGCPRGGGRGEGWIGSLGLANANYCT